MIKKILFYIIYFLSSTLPIAAIYFSSPVYASSVRFISMLLGATAFSLLNIQLVLSARPKFIERSFGLDRFYRFHSIMAPVAIVLAGMHQEIGKTIFSENLQTNFGEAAFGIFIFCAICALVLMTENMFSRFGFIRKVQVYFQKKEFGKYNVQLLLHNFNILAVLLLFVHVMLSSSARNPLVKTIYILYFSIAMGFYLYHKLIRPSFFSKRFLVERVTAESPSISTLELRPANGKNFTYDPGQFVFIKITDPAISKEEHPFSLTSQPANQQTITISVKKLGDWTEKVDEIKSGSTVSIDGPYGKFSPVNYDCSNGIVLIAGGIGITPMLGILRHFVKSDREQKIILFWSVKKTADLVYEKEFKRILAKMKNFSFIPVVSQDDFNGERGRISKEMIVKYIEVKAYDANKLQYFFCGPGSMWTVIEEILFAMKIKKKQMHRENFSL